LQFETLNVNLRKTKFEHRYLVEFERHVKSRHVLDNIHHHYCDQYINVKDVKT